jgi:hypothetical protein
MSITFTSSRSRPRILAVLLLTVACTLTGCGTRPPAITVGEPVIADQSDQAVVLRFPIEAARPHPNPGPAQPDNDRELNLPIVDYSLDLDGARIYSGSRSPESTLRRLGRQSFVVPVVVPIETWNKVTSGTDSNNYTFSGRLRYRPPGPLSETLFDLGVRRPSQAFSGQGRLSEAKPAPSPLPAESTPDSSPTP